MTDAIRKLVVDALDQAAGIRANPAFAAALNAGDDIELAALEVDSLSRFEAMMAIEDALGIELDDDEVMAQQTLDRLVAHVAGLAARSAGAIG